jgi:hypothetical protein
MALIDVGMPCYAVHSSVVGCSCGGSALPRMQLLVRADQPSAVHELWTGVLEPNSVFASALSLQA